MTQTVLITGCSNGFGNLTAQNFLGTEWNVVASMRAPEKAPELADGDRMLVLKLDVTDPDSVSGAFAAARTIRPRGRCHEQRRPRPGALKGWSDKPL